MLLSFSQEFYDAIEAFKAHIMELEKQWQEFIDFFCEKEEIEKCEAHFEPCLCVPLPPRTYRSFKLWRKNRALFRPYKRNI